MNQSFSTVFPWGQKTFFIEKLWKMAIQQGYFDRMEFYYTQGVARAQNIIIMPYDEYAPKLHTIRGFSDRYKVGQMQQPFVWKGKPCKEPIFRFMPMITLISKQKIKIEWTGSVEHKDLGVSVFIDGTFQSFNQVKILAKNDGFDNVTDFFRWFDKDFEGEIRHYTDLKY